MLGKLIKHEFRATGRIMLPICGLLMLLAAAANLATRVLDNSHNSLLNLIGGVIVFAFALGLFVVGIAAVILMIQRFYRNLLSDEGYLMFTLPVSVHGLVWSRIIVSLVWFIVTFVAIFLAAIIVSFRLEFVDDFFRGMREFFRYLEMNFHFDLNYTLFFFEVLALTLLGGIMSCLMVYAAMAVGYGFAKHKAALSIGFFLLFSFLMQTLGMYGLFRVLDAPMMNHITSVNTGVHVTMSCFLGYALLFSAIYYIITTACLQKRLNLQ